MDPSTEIRKLPPNNLRELVQILEQDECWKRLMCIIPKSLKANNYECTNLPKYNTEHFRIIEDAAVKRRRACADILFDEWGTSGRIRPALGHLLYLLTKSQLFRVADYVAVKLLGVDVPPRPATGPAALISTSLSEQPDDLELREVERILDEINYPSLLISNNSCSPPVIPKIVVSEVPDPLVKDRKSHTESRNVIEFSKNESESKIPHFSQLMSKHEETDELYLPNLSILEKESDSNDNLPAFSSLISKNESVVEICNEISDFIPNVSLLQSKKEPNVSQSDLPQLSILLARNSDSGSLPVSLDFSQNSNSRPTYISPLPNLSLNTLLPHFPYRDIEIATKDFDRTPYENCRQLEDSSIESNGRFLGCGAFGSVFLALGLIDRPVAVKKLFLDNVDVVNIDDTVTKQFRNEVEVLSKYKHDNLLSLIGYSCDGPTYGLLYEFIAGGSLKDRLQNQDDKLLWTERIHIALGTAKAISYLHTAYTTPLIHRDIKTANILLDCSKKPKLADFGLIKLTPNQTTITNTTIFGTSAYMAREAFRGDVSVKLDTFSFGVVLLELITSLPPLDENREGKDLVTHVEEMCENKDITPLIDENAGSWIINDNNYAQQLFEIASMCIEENKKKRPYMVDVTKKLEILMERISEMDLLFLTDDKEPMKNRLSETTEKFICRAIGRTIYPKVAKNKHNKWKYIVNGDDENGTVQRIRIELCERSNGKCDLVNNFPFG